MDKHETLCPHEVPYTASCVECAMGEEIARLREDRLRLLAREAAMEEGLRATLDYMPSTSGRREDWLCVCRQMVPYSSDGIDTAYHEADCPVPAARALLAPPECETCGGSGITAEPTEWDYEHGNRGVPCPACPVAVDVPEAIRDTISEAWTQGYIADRSFDSDRVRGRHVDAAVDALLSRLAAPVDPKPLRELVWRVVETCAGVACVAGGSGELPPEGFESPTVQARLGAAKDAEAGVRALAADDAAIDRLVEGT